MDGSQSSQTEIVLKFVAKLAARTNIPIFLQDERMTSKAADNFLKLLGSNRKKRNDSDDAVAAALILETVLQSVINIRSAASKAEAGGATA